MITVTVLYKNSDSIKFNMNYYLESHIGLLKKLLGPALKNTLVQQGIGTGPPGTPPEYAVLTVLFFDSMESFQKAFMPHAPAIMGDLVNFTNVEPTVHYSDVRLG
jgi:uncharacterized protein (TIGR02118 family)